MHSISSTVCPSRRSFTVTVSAMTTSVAAPNNADQPPPRRSEAKPHWECAEESALRDALGVGDAPGVSRRSGRESQPWLDDELARRVDLILLSLRVRGQALGSCGAGPVSSAPRRLGCGSARGPVGGA